MDNHLMLMSVCIKKTLYFLKEKIVIQDFFWKFSWMLVTTLVCRCQISLNDLLLDFLLIFWISWKNIGPYWKETMINAGDHTGSPATAFFEHFERLARGRTFSGARPRKWVFSTPFSVVVLLHLDWWLSLYHTCLIFVV